jgi:hypothetical protein
MNDRARPLTRRLVNALLAGAIAWPAANGAVRLLVQEWPDFYGSPRYLLLSIFRNRRSACAIGAACLKSLPDNESTGQQIWDKIVATAFCGTETMRSKEAVRRQIADQVRLDFTQGAVISVDRWLLSVTEARVYALIALSSEIR